MEIIGSEVLLYCSCILLSLVKIAVSTEFPCSGLSPGYYADISSSCTSYLLCMDSSRSMGMKFSCPKGTKFQQKTLVCDHAYSVHCQDSYKYFRNNINIWETNTIVLNEEFDTKKEDTRKKREKKIGHNVIKEKVKKGVHINQISLKKAVNVTEPESSRRNVSKPKQIPKVKAKILSERKQMILKEKEAHIKSAGHRKINVENSNNTSKSNKNETYLDLRQISECKRENYTYKVMNIIENKTIEKEHKKKLMLPPNTKSATTAIPDNNQVHLSINSMATGTGAFKRLNKSLDKIPFSRVVGVQSKTGNSVSPFFSFSSLVSLLTKSSTPVRMIPVAVTSKEAELIRKEVLKGQTLANKKVTKHGRHPRLIKQIKRTGSDQNGGRWVQENRYAHRDSIEKKEVAEKVKEKVTMSEKEPISNSDYQLIYKSGNSIDNSIRKQTKYLKNAKQEEKYVKVEPRGSSTGFSRREKLPSLPAVTALATDIVPTTYFPPNNIHFDAKLDTLQAPSKETSHVHNNINVKRNISRLRTKAVRRKDRKSNLDLLGIFDTRKYFFIPQNRRIEERLDQYFPFS